MNAAILVLVTNQLIARFKAVVREKESSAVMKVIAFALGLGSLFADVPSEAVFLTRYATTLAFVVFMPKGVTAPEAVFLLLCHELSHVVQFWRLGPIKLVRMYLTAEGRALLETEAERGRIEAHHRLYGTIPTEAQLSASIEHGYAFEQGEILTGHALLEQAVTEVAAGVYRTEMGRAVDELLTAQGHARPGGVS